DSLPVGLTLDRAAGTAVSRFSRAGELPIEIVAIEPIDSFWGRYLRTLAIGSALGLVLLGGFVYGLLRYTRHRLSMGTLLRQALAKGRNRGQYQAVVELRDGEGVGAEALAGWTLDGGESVAPKIFIPSAEREGMIPDITLAILHAPLRELRSLLLEREELSINLNVSPE